jgi:uncharacterized cupredoxin-like copper-binding protein
MKIRSSLMTLAVTWLATTASAGGTHAGGHGHDASDIGQAGQVSRTIQVDMTDNMRFTPNQVAVEQGETIRFVVKNSGRLKHEFVMGKVKALKEHYALMKKFPEMEHADANMLTVAPGQTGELVWQFTKSGPVDFACLQSGHYEAGMKGAIQVARGKAIANPGKDMALGEVRKIDKDTRKITIQHGEIKNLEMPPMTMVFRVRELALLDKVQLGDKVQFKAITDSGALVVTDLQTVR